MSDSPNWQQNRQLPDYLEAWIRMQFMNVEPIFGLDAEGIQAPEDLVRCCGYVRSRDLAWFTDPARWNRRQELGLRHLFFKDPVLLAQTMEGDDGMEVFSFHLRNTGPFQLRCNRTRIGPEDALAGLSAPHKCLGFLAPPDRDGLVVKSSSDLQGLLSEAEVLHALPATVLAPVPRGVFLAATLPADGLAEVGLSLEGENQSLETLLPGIPLGKHGDYQELEDGIKAAILEALQQLVYPDRLTFLRQQADQLRRELQAANWFEQPQHDLIASILDVVQDRSLIAASRCHGDLRPDNLQICPLDLSGESYTCGIGLFDWEFTHDNSLGLLDWMSLLMDAAYVECHSFEALLEQVRSRELRQVASTALPGCGLPFGQLFALHFVRYLLDRHPRPDQPNLPERAICLRDILASDPTPFRAFLKREC